MERNLKPDLPIYSIDIFYGAEFNILNFEMKIIQNTLEAMSFTKTPHRHDCYLIILITQGSGLHIIDNINYNVKPFALYFLMPGQVHSWEFSDDIEGYAIYFKLDFYTNYIRERHLTKIPLFQFLSNQNYLQLDKKAEESIVAILKIMYWEFSSNATGREEILRNGLDMLLIRISRYCESKNMMKSPHSRSLKVRTLQRLIEENFRQLKLPNEYADKINISPKHLNALCKRTLNKTVSDLIHDRIILEAKRLLTYTDFRIKEIADELGFNDKSYFLRFFKKRAGVTPDQFRQTNLIKEEVR